MTVSLASPIVRCCRGTFNGEAASQSKYGFAPCVREFDHPNVGTGCDSGPATSEAASPSQQDAA